MRDTFPMMGKRQEALRKLSQQGENVWKLSGNFPNKGKTSGSSQETFPTVGQCVRRSRVKPGDDE
jgi:hypothetical protein